MKFLLHQWLSMIPQHQWANKLIGFDFRVEYRLGPSNVMVDALSHQDSDDTTTVAALSALTFHIFDALRQEFATVLALIKLRQEIEAEVRGELWRIVDGLVIVKGKVYVPSASPSLQEILVAAHGVGHEGTEKTLHCPGVNFFVPSAQAVVREWVCLCLTCQWNKMEQLHLTDLLQPLQVPSTVWVDIAVDLIKGLPKVGGKSYILTVVDRFSM
jgi:hypothetical protein